MSGIVLTTEELNNIYKTYAHFGAEKLGEFIQAVWKEAYEEGYDKAVRDKRGATPVIYPARG